MASSWETIDHTGDVGIVVRAPTLPELFATAARAMYALCLDPDRVRAEREERIEVEAATLDDVFFEWLREVHARLVADGVVYAEFEIDRVDERGLAARVRGEDFDPARHGAFTELKAVTAHELSVRREGELWVGRVIFDV